MTNPPPQKPRWQHRFDNYKRAFVLLREAIELMDTRELTALEIEGTIQRFEYTWELAWKLLKDYLEDSGVVLPVITPAAVIRAAIAAKLIDDGDVWMQALDARNKLSHTYSSKIFEATIADIKARFLGLLDELHTDMLARVLNGGVP